MKKISTVLSHSIRRHRPDTARSMKITELQAARAFKLTHRGGWGKRRARVNNQRNHLLRADRRAIFRSGPQLWLRRELALFTVVTCTILSSACRKQLGIGVGRELALKLGCLGGGARLAALRSSGSRSQLLCSSGRASPEHVARQRRASAPRTVCWRGINRVLLPVRCSATYSSAV